MAQNLQINLDEGSIKKLLERFRTVLNDMSSMSSGSRFTFNLNDAINLIDVFLKRLDETKQKIEKMPDVTKSTGFKNDKISKQAYDSLLERVKEIRQTVDGLAKYEFTLDNKGKMQQALITYRDGLGKIVTETMKWREKQEEVNGVIHKTRIFETSGYKYSDDLTQQVNAVRNIERYYTSINKRIEGLKKSYIEVFENPHLQKALEQRFADFKNVIEQSKSDPKTFDKSALNDEWKSIVAQVRHYNNLVVQSSNQQEQLETRIYQIQKDISTLRTKNLTAQSAEKNNNTAKITALNAELDILKKQLTTKNQLDTVNKNQAQFDRDLIAKEVTTKQKQNYDEIMKILPQINKYAKEIANNSNTESETYKRSISHLQEQIDLYEQLMNSEMILSNGTREWGLSHEQVASVLEREKQIYQDIADLEVKNAERIKNAQKTSSDTDPLDRFGKKIESPLTFESSKQQIQSYLEEFTKGEVKINKFNDEISKSGKVVKQLDFFAKDADGNMHKFQLTIDKATNSSRIMDMGMRKLNETHRTLGERLTYSIGKIAEWAVATGAVYMALNQLRQGFEFINDLNESLTEIGIVTYQNQQQVAQYAQTYNALAKEMRVTTDEVAKASVEFYRQGLTQSQVMERMKSTTQFAKISNLEFSESAKILTATVNSMNVPIERATDIFAYLGRICPVA